MARWSQPMVSHLLVVETVQQTTLYYCHDLVNLSRALNELVGDGWGRIASSPSHEQDP